MDTIPAIPECVDNDATVCIPNNSSFIQYLPAEPDHWTVPLGMTSAGNWLPLKETHTEGDSAVLTFNGELI